MASNLTFDSGSIIRAVYDNPSQSINVNLVGSGTPTLPNVVRLADGVDFLTTTVIGPVRSLDVSVKNMPEIIISDVDDSIKIGNGSGIFLDINSDRSANVRDINRLVTVPFDSILPSYPSGTQEIYLYKTGGLAGTTVATVTVNYTDATKNVILNIART